MNNRNETDTRTNGRYERTIPDQKESRNGHDAHNPAGRENIRQIPNPLAPARESFSGRLLTDPQFDEAIAITGIIEREIKKSGAFKEKLGDYAYAFARTEKFDAMKAETILRDLFKERVGITMNQMREDLVEREQKLTDNEKRRAYDHAYTVGHLIEAPPRMPFHRAYAQQAQLLAGELGVTDAAAKSLMVAEFKAVEKIELYDWGKDREERFYRPQIEAEKQRRDDGQRDNRQTQTRRRPGPSGP